MTFTGIESLTLPLAVLALLLMVFLADLLVPAPSDGRQSDAQRGLGALTCVGLVGVILLSWWMPQGGLAFGGAYVQDAFATYLQRVLLAAAALGALGSIDHVDRNFPSRQGEYYLMLLFSLLGMVVLAGARELVLIIVAFELMGIPLYVLAAMQKRAAGGVEGSLKLYLTGAVSSAVTLYGMSFIYGVTGTTNLTAIAARLSLGDDQGPLLVLGLLLSLAGMGFKIGVVPFHMWVPDTYQGSPTPFVAFLSVAPKAAGFGVLVRLFVEGLGAMRDTWWPIVLVLCVATMVVGNLFALSQRNVKRLLAWSGVAHIGLMLLAFGIATVQGIGVLIFYLTAYVFTNMGAFFIVDVVGQDGSDDLDAWQGLARRSPALGGAMLIFLLSLGGIPFVAGFWAKFLLFWAAWQAGMGLLVLLGALLAVLALFYYLKVARSMFIEGTDGPAPRVALPTALAITIALLGVIGIGVYPQPFVDAALAAAAGLLGG
ncbi:MAG: NADH-quinone oxidoreductase subunit N [Oligoflexia bacterium]|nr:NADH-quinone oxidoreductase subunit N [Oligoflexia bacterium]